MNNNIRSFRWVLAAFGIALVSSLSLAKKDPYIFKFGMMSPDTAGNSQVFIETREIEKYVDPAHMHGFTLKRKDGSQFYVYYVIRFPEPLKDLPEGIEQYYQVLEGGKVLQSSEELKWEISRGFIFSKTDPVGTYQLEVYVDNELYRKIDYNVVDVPNYKF